MFKKVFLGIFIGLIFLLCLFLIILNLSGYQNYIVVSSSMHPAIPKYSLVYIENYDLEDMKKLEVGDVIAVRTSSDPMLHRIIKIDAETIQTQGDANNSPDSPIRFKQVIGKKVFSIPYLGILFISPYPWLILMALLIILLIGRQLIKEIQKK